jgi:hypothetical protein
MTRAIKITFIVAAVIGFGGGIVCGCYRAAEASSYMQSAEVVSIPSVASDFASQQFQHADSAHARQAVLLELKLLDQLHRAAHDSSSESQLGLAYTFAYIRLAMIEEAAGQTEAERRAMDEAKVRFNRKRPNEEVTDEQMKNALKRFDAASDRL